MCPELLNAVGSPILLRHLRCDIAAQKLDCNVLVRGQLPQQCRNVTRSRHANGLSIVDQTAGCIDKLHYQYVKHYGKGSGIKLRDRIVHLIT
jgi:hypothetical protein